MRRPHIVFLKAKISQGCMPHHFIHTHTRLKLHAAGATLLY